MPTELTPDEVGTLPLTAGTVLTFTAADTVSDNEAPFTKDSILLAHNTSNATHNVTITSVDDEFGRSEDLTESIASDAIVAYKIGQHLPAWLQLSSAKLFFEADHATVEFCVIKVVN